MRDSKVEEDWYHTAFIVATIENNAFGRKRRATQPIDRHPMKRSIKGRHRRKKRLSNEQAERILDRMMGTGDG